MKYIVNVSGGLTSYEALRRTIVKHGLESTLAIFADTQDEDEDLYRFLRDIEKYLGIEIITLREGRNVWEVINDEKCLTSRSFAPCSKILKRDIIDKYITSLPYSNIIQVFGMDWSELNRIERLRDSLGYNSTWFPLLEKPYPTKNSIITQLLSVGIEPPILYSLGFNHNNCGGKCVKAGKSHYALLLKVRRESYLELEDKESKFIDMIGEKHTILSEVRGGIKYRITLKEYRERLENGEVCPTGETGGCNCFVEE